MTHNGFESWRFSSALDVYNQKNILNNLNVEKLKILC
jgi:hypothetical protein